jgi:hypothetical protein
MEGRLTYPKQAYAEKPIKIMPLLSGTRRMSMAVIETARTVFPLDEFPNPSFVAVHHAGRLFVRLRPAKSRTTGPLGFSIRFGGRTFQLPLTYGA